MDFLTAQGHENCTVSATQHLSLDVAHEPRSRHRIPKLQFLDSNEFWIVRNQTPYQFECCSANELKTNILKVVLSELFLVIGQVGALFLGSRLCDFHLCMARNFQGFRTTQPRNRQHFDLVLKEVGPLNWPHCLEL